MGMQPVLSKATCLTLGFMLELFSPSQFLNKGLHFSIVPVPANLVGWPANVSRVIFDATKIPFWMLL